MIERERELIFRVCNANDNMELEMSFVLPDVFRRKVSGYFLVIIKGNLRGSEER